MMKLSVEKLHITCLQKVYGALEDSIAVGLVGLTKANSEFKVLYILLILRNFILFWILWSMRVIDSWSSYIRIYILRSARQQIISNILPKNVMFAVCILCNFKTRIWFKNIRRGCVSAEIFSAISVIQPQPDGVYSIHALSKRLSKTRTWVISFFLSL